MRLRLSEAQKDILWVEFFDSSPGRVRPNRIEPQLDLPQIAQMPLSGQKEHVSGVFLEETHVGVRMVQNVRLEHDFYEKFKLKYQKYLTSPFLPVKSDRNV